MIRLRIRLQRGSKGVTVHLRHHHIAEHQVGQALQRLGERLAAVRAGANVVVARELLCEVVANLVVVLNDDDDLSAVLLRIPFGGVVVEQLVHFLFLDAVELGLGETVVGRCLDIDLVF